MTAKVQKWGNSLAVRIPSAMATEAGLSEGAAVEFKVVDGVLVIRPARKRYTLDELLAGMTEENLHPLWDTGPPVGKEQL